MTEEYKIEKDLPIRGGYTTSNTPLSRAADKMEVGDSINLGDYMSASTEKLQNMLKTRHGPDAQVTCRRLADDTMQVWRIK